MGQSELSVRKQERQEVDLDDEFESDSMPEVDDPRAMADGQDQTNGVNPPGPANNDFASQEELLRAYRATESRLVEKEREAEEYRSILEQMGAGTRRLQVQADEETFIKEARESYQKDPVAAFMMMLTKARNEFRDTVEERIGQVFQEQHRKDVVLVLGRVDRAAKRVAGGPYGVADAAGPTVFLFANFMYI